jgi:CBS domain-containing membrane protein
MDLEDIDLEDKTRVLPDTTQRKARFLRKTKYVIYKQTLINPADHLWAFLGAFVGIASIGYIQSLFLEELPNIFLIGSFGASAVLVYGASNSPLAQPRNLIGGHLLCAVVGVNLALLIPDSDYNWLTASLAVSMSIVGMQMTKTMHPPGGATALIAVIGGDKIRDLKYLYILSPVLSGVLIIFVVGMIVNNLSKNRRYPTKGVLR